MMHPHDTIFTILDRLWSDWLWPGLLIGAFLFIVVYSFFGLYE